MAKVYLVTEGCYSDYRVLGVYSTKENADYAHVLYASDNKIEEYDLDYFGDDPRDGLLPYAVEMKKTGDVAEVIRWGVHEVPSSKWVPLMYSDAVRFFVRARDDEHAVKIANERRAELIASESWTTNYAEWRKRLTSLDTL